MRITSALGILALVGSACHRAPTRVPLPPPAVDSGSPGDAGTPIPSFRCPIDLTPYQDPAGQGAFVRPITSASDLLTGDAAQGKLGDFLMGNATVRVIVQGQDRHLGPQPWGGNIIDAALVGPDMHDSFGELGLLYNFGRTVNAQHFEILADGSAGGSAILAASGPDDVNNWLGVTQQLKYKLGEGPAVDPDQALPLRITHYYLLSPGEQRVRFVTALCNDGAEPTTLEVGDLTDPGGAVDFFNPQACVHGFGYASGYCFGLDPLSWYGYQGDDIAYGYAPYKVGAPTVPEEVSAILTIAGVSGTLLSAPGTQGLLNWLNPNLTSRAGQLTLPAGGSGTIARDFVIGHDIGEVASLIAGWRGPLLNRTPVALSGTVVDPSGQPIAGARVAVEQSLEVSAVFTTRADGSWSGSLDPGTYQVSAWATGRAPSAPASLTLAGPPVTQSLSLGPTRTLSVTVADQSGSPLPAKITLICPNGCSVPSSQLDRYQNTVIDPLPNDVQLQGFVPPSGQMSFQVPPGVYTAVVSRGPTWSVYPSTWPTQGLGVDLTESDGSVNATLVKVIDTQGWMGADFHVHAVNSPDSFIPNQDRVLTFLAEGVDVLVSTDHDYVSDLSPYNQALGGQSLMATVIGDEASPMDFGHYILFPFPQQKGDLNGGALDWAGGEGPTLTLGQLFSAAKQLDVGTIQFNHPRGYLGGLSFLQVDMDTLASHAPASDFRMQPTASSANDTGLMSGNFNTFEVFNPGNDLFDPVNAHSLMNDWFTLLSKGVLVAATGVSDTHVRFSSSAGYWRTFVDMGDPSVGDITGPLLSDAINAMKGVASNGPFVLFTGTRLGSAGGAGATLEPGGTIPQGAGDIYLTVDVQVPTSMDLTRIEIYTHQPQDDASCPVAADDPNASTTRVGCNGLPSTHWPSSSILETREVTLTTADLETVTTVEGAPIQRYHHVETFRYPAPTQDNWLVAMVYGSADLFPLTYANVDSSGNRVPAAPFAMTNPIFVDADGDGYNHPPFGTGAPQAAPVHRGPRAHVPDATELNRMLDELQHH